MNSNILSSTSEITIIDFGLAKKVDESGFYGCAGSFNYSSPQTLTGSLTTKNCDIWSLGCIIYKSLTRKHPFAEDYKDIPGYPKVRRAQTFIKKSNFNWKMTPKHYKELAGFSRVCVDFVEACLDPCGPTRQEAKDLVQHEWFE